MVRRTWVMAAGRHFAFKIVANPLQMETRLLLTTIETHRHIQRYKGRPFTTYRLAIIHALQTDDRRHIVPKARPLYGRQKNQSKNGCRAASNFF